MSVAQEIDRALHDEMRTIHMAPRDATMLIVLNTEASNDLDEWMVTQIGAYTYELKEHFRMHRYRGKPIATTYDSDMPRVTIFSKPKRGT